MSRFAETLKTLPTVDHIEAIVLYEGDGDAPSELIENRPGKSGSVAVYHALFMEFGKLDAAAARKGLELYAEHVADAEAHPGKHPNIDRLFRVIAKQSEVRMKIRESN